MKNPDAFAISPNDDTRGNVTYKVVNAAGDTVYEQSTDDYPIRHFNDKDTAGNVLADGHIHIV